MPSVPCWISRWFQSGWMMWNWMVSALSLGCALVLYDGSPLVPSPSTLWDLVDTLKITIFGTGAKWLAVLEDKVRLLASVTNYWSSLLHWLLNAIPLFRSCIQDVHPRSTHDLSSLHTILSTGSPLRPGSYDYVYSSIKPDVLLGRYALHHSKETSQFSWIRKGARGYLGIFVFFSFKISNFQNHSRLHFRGDGHNFLLHGTEHWRAGCSWRNSGWSLLPYPPYLLFSPFSFFSFFLFFFLSSGISAKKIDILLSFYIYIFTQSSFLFYL